MSRSDSLSPPINTHSCLFLHSLFLFLLWSLNSFLSLFNHLPPLFFLIILLFLLFLVFLFILFSFCYSSFVLFVSFSFPSLPLLLPGTCSISYYFFHSHSYSFYISPSFFLFRSYISFHSFSLFFFLSFPSFSLLLFLI